MAEKIQLPDGSFFPLKPGEDPARAMMEAASLYPEAFAPTAPKQQGPAPQSGFLPAAKAGLSSLKSDITALAGRTGLMDTAEAEKAIKAEEEYQRRTYKPTETWGEAPLTKGLELLGGSLPYMAAPLAAGLGAAALPLTGAAATAAGLGATGLASLTQFTGSNLSRQMQEGKALGQTELGSAVGAAIPQAALDLVSFKMMPGIRQILAAGGKEVSEKAAVEIAKQGTAQIAKDYAAATGKAMGAEGLTEAGQQFFERLQAGLNLTDEKARNEYWDSLIGGAVLGGVISPAGRYIERGQQAQKELDVAKQKNADAVAEANRLAAEEAKKQEAYRQTPEYLTEIQTRYDSLVKQLNDLTAKTKVKPEGADPASQQIAAEQREEAKKALSEFKDSDEYRNTLSEYVAARPRLKGIEEQKKATEAVFGTEPTYAAEDMSPVAQATRLQKQIDDLKKQQAKLTPVQQQPLQNRINALETSIAELGLPTQPEIDAARARIEKSLGDVQEKLTTDFATADLERHNANIARHELALKELDALQKFAQKPVQGKSLGEIQDLMDAAQQAGDVEAVRRLTPMLAEAERQPELPFETGYAAENKLAEEIAQGREDAARRREKVEAETNALLRIGERPLTPFALGRREATLREARETLRAATKPTGRTVSKGTAYQVVDGKLGAATEISKIVRRNEQDWASFSKETDADKMRTVQERERFRQELKNKLKELEDDYSQFVTPSPALQQLHQTYTNAIKQTLADVERKLALTSQAKGDATSMILSASDQRVADLIDRLLGPATERTAEEKAQRPLEGMQPSLFDVEEQKKIAEAARSTTLPGQLTTARMYDEEGNLVYAAERGTRAEKQAQGELPIEQAQRLMEEAQGLREQLKEYNDQIKSAGRPTDPAKVARLNDLKELRDSALKQLTRVQQEYDRVVQMQTPAYTGAEAAPTTADLFGGLEETRAEQNKIQKDLDQLYKERDTIRADLQRRGQLGATPQLQALVDEYSKDTPRLRQIEAEIEKQEAELERVSGKRSARFDEFAQAREAERVVGGPDELARLEDELRSLRSAQPYMQQAGQGQAAQKIADAIAYLESRIDKLKEGKAPAQARERTETLPGFERRAGVKPVDEQQLREARTDLVSLQNAEEELRKARASQDSDPTRYLRQLAAAKQEQYEAFLVQSDDPITKTWPAQKLTILKRRYPKTIVPTERDLEANDALRKQIKYFENIMRGGKRRDIEQALQDNLAKQDKARERIAELESRQRAYEQQEAVRTGAAPGEAEAQRLLAGAGYRTQSGATRKMPKKLASWGITEITKKTATPVAPVKVAATSNLLRQYQKQTEAEATSGAFKQDTLGNQLKKATANIEKLNAALQQVYPTTVAETTDREITDLLAAGMSPEARANMRDMAQVYANLKNSVAGNTINDVIARLEELKADLLQQARQGGRFTARRGGVELHRNEVEDDIKGIKALHKRTESGTVQERVADLTKTIRHLMMQPKTADPWVAAFNALIQETNAKALLASQEARYAGLVVASEKRKLDSFTADTQKRIADANKMPASAEKTSLLEELNNVLEQQLAGLSVEPRAVSDVTALGMEETQRRYEVGAYNAQLDAYNKAVDENDVYQEQYQKARLEQLSLLKAYGSDLQNNINAEVEKIQTLTPQLEAQAKENAETKAKLDKANQALAKANVAEREAAAKTVPSQTAALTYTGQEREALQRIREGLGLPGTRYETDTTSALVTKTKAAIRQTLTLEQAKLDKAREADDVATVQAQTLKVQELQKAFESVQQLGERVVTPVGEGAAEREVERMETDVLPGTRLPRRRVGPVARVGTQPPGQMLSGTAESREAISKGNRPMQAGTQRLTAADMDPQSASSISLAVLQQQRNAATGERKTQLDAAFKAATDGMTKAQIDAKIKEGEDLIKVPGAATVVAAREKVRAANAALKAAEADRKAATTPAAKEIAQDSVELAQADLDRAYAKLEAAQNAVAAGVELTDTPKTLAEKAIEEGLRLEETGGGVYGEDLAPTTYTSTATRTDSNPAVREAILDGRLLDALDRLAVEGASDLIKQNAKDLKALVLRTKVILDPNLTVDGVAVPAAYSPSLNAIIFRPSEITDEDIIHEATHAATMRVLTMPDADLTDRQRNAKKELEAIYKQASKNKALMDEHGLKNMKEFVSEVQSNAEFRAAINKQPWYKRIWNALLRLISKDSPEAIADRASRLVKELYLPSQKIEEKTLPTQAALPSVFRRTPNPTSALVGYEPGTLEKLKGNFFGLAGRVQHFDRLAAADAGIVAAESAGKLTSTEAFNAQYFMRLGDNVTQAAGQFITSGPVRIVADKRPTGTEYRYESSSGANLVNVSEQLELMARAGKLDSKEAERMATSLLAGERASATPSGWDRLMTDPAKRAEARAEYDADVAFMKRNPEAKKHMDALAQEYKKYNDNLLDFTVDCGFMSKAEADRLKKTPYVPFYRIDNGVVKLYTGSEHPIRIGNIKENPDLARFLGDTQTILPLLTSAVQNTFMLTRAAMNNKATLETTRALYKAGFVSKAGKGPGPADADTVHYKLDGVDHFATIDSDTFGIPAHLIVKGMEGIKTTIPALVQMLGIPANLLRKFIVRSPAYVVRQILREPINSFLQSGIDGVPVANALKEMANMRAGRSPSEEALMRGLVVSSNIYTGDRQDMTKFLSDIASGRSRWDKALAWMDTLALQADTATRALAYNDGLKKGLSEAQAQFRALEMQNFSRRGLSPSMQVLSTLIPFFNAQIQGLDVLYRSLSGKTPFAKELDIRRKLVARTTMLAATALAYAYMMQDNEEYRKATPAERYGNLFVPIPGSKDMMKVPIGFEIGTLTMGLMQALVDTAAGDTKAKDAIMGMGKLLANSAPSVIPAAGKPLIEAVYGATTQGPIESAREKMLEATDRYRSTTSELAKAVGGITGMVGVSPIMLEHFVRGYTGSLGVALIGLANPILRPAAAGEKPTTELSKQPFIGGLFQTGEGRFLIDRAYDYMEHVIQAQQTYKDMVSRGRLAEAKAFAQQRADLLAGASAAGAFRQRMGDYFAQERAIRDNPKLSQERKDELLEKLKKAENREAEQFYSLSGRTIRQASPG